jgi:hypothetical protein
MSTSGSVGVRPPNVSRRRAARGLATAVAGLALLLGAGPLTAQGKVQKVSKKLVDRAEDTLKNKYLELDLSDDAIDKLKSTNQTCGARPRSSGAASTASRPRSGATSPPSSRG